MTIDEKVKRKLIKVCCADCAAKHRTQAPYDGIYSQYQSECEICKETKPVTSASKLFGYHKFI